MLLKYTGFIVEGSEYITHLYNENNKTITSRVSFLIQLKNGVQKEVVAEGQFFNNFTIQIKFLPYIESGFGVTITGSSKKGYIEATKIKELDSSKTYFIKSIG